MRNRLLIVVLVVLLAPLLPPSVHAAESSGAAKPDKFSIPSKSLPVKSRASANPCADYGPGFGKVDGTDTCVKIGGSVSADGVASGRLR